MRFLVTGGAGFIGSNLVRELLNRGQKVRVIDNFITGKRGNLLPFIGNPDLEVIEGDLRCFDTVCEVVSGCDYVIHLAAMPVKSIGPLDPVRNDEINTVETFHVLEAARTYSVKRVVFSSSSDVYGKNATIPKIENMHVAPISPVALSKYVSECYCRFFHSRYGLETVVLRYFSVFGPNQNGVNQGGSVIPTFINQIRSGTRPVIYGDGLQSRDFIYVGNIVEATIRACLNPGVAGEVFNIASGERYTLIDLLNYINAILGTHVEPVYEPSRPGEVKHCLADIQKAKLRLGFEVKISFLEGLERTIKHFL